MTSCWSLRAGSSPRRRATCRSSGCRRSARSTRLCATPSVRRLFLSLSFFSAYANMTLMLITYRRHRLRAQVGPVRPRRLVLARRAAFERPSGVGLLAAPDVPPARVRRARGDGRRARRGVAQRACRSGRGRRRHAHERLQQGACRARRLLPRRAVRLVPVARAHGSAPRGASASPSLASPPLRG